MTTSDPELSLDTAKGSLDILTEGAPTPEDRQERLAEGAEEVSTKRSSILAHPKLLLIGSATLMSVGVTAILLGWAGASRSTFIEEQTPYVISGGLLGVALAIMGALMLFTHWLTVALRQEREHEAARRADHQALMDALTELGVTITQETQNGSARGAGNRRPLRATPGGS